MRSVRKDPVTPQLREKILKRDCYCFMRRMDPLHRCMDVHRNFHSSWDTDKLTLDHVHESYGLMGKRAPSDERHLVAMCAHWHLNIGPTRVVREAEREYLNGVYGEEV